MKFFVCAVFCWCVLTNSAFPQEGNSDYLTQDRRLQFTIAFDGRVNVIRFETLCISYLSNSQKLLELKAVCKEIDLDVDQSSEIKELLSSSSAFRTELYDRSAMKTKNELTDEFRRESEKFEKSIRNILSPRQQEILSKIDERAKFRQLGPLEYFKDLGPREKEFALTQREQDRITKAVVQLRQEIEPQGEKLAKEYLQKILAQLTEEQHAELRKRFDLNQLGFASNVDLFVSLLDDENNNEWSSRYPQAVLNQLVVFFVSADGFLVAQKNANRLFQSTAAEEMIPYIEFLESMKTDSVRDRLQLEPEQLEVVVDALSGMLSADLEIIDRLKTSDNVVLALEISRDQQQTVTRNAYSKVTKILSPNQLNSLKELFSDAAVFRFGIYSELIGGELGKVLKVTEKQKADIRKCASEIRGDFRTKSANFERYYIETVVDCLDSKRNKSLAESLLLREKFDHIAANVTELIRAGE
jgi:hypothetical protein